MGKNDFTKAYNLIDNMRKPDQDQAVDPDDNDQAVESSINDFFEKEKERKKKPDPVKKALFDSLDDLGKSKEIEDQPDDGLLDMGDGEIYTLAEIFDIDNPDNDPFNGKDSFMLKVDKKGFSEVTTKGGCDMDINQTESKSKRVNLLLQPSVHAVAKQRADEIGISLNEYISVLIKKDNGIVDLNMFFYNQRGFFK